MMQEMQRRLVGGAEGNVEERRTLEEARRKIRYVCC